MIRRYFGGIYGIAIAFAVIAASAVAAVAAVPLELVHDFPAHAFQLFDVVPAVDHIALSVVGHDIAIGLSLSAVFFAVAASALTVFSLFLRNLAADRSGVRSPVFGSVSAAI